MMNSNRKKTIRKILKLYATYDFPEDINEEFTRWLINELQQEDSNEVLWEVWNNLVPSPQADEEEALKAIKDILEIETKHRRLINRKFILKIAAVVIPIILISSLIPFLYQPTLKNSIEISEIPQTIIHTEKDLKKNIVLADGTQLWLNTDTELSYFTEREVRLEGEAYFDVASQEGKNFTVETEHLKVTVTGTNFNINSYPHLDKVVISLYEGKLLVENTDTLIALNAGQELVYNPSKLDFQIYNITRMKPNWLRNIINFEDTRIEDILESISKMYGCNIDYGDFNEVNQRINFKFENANISLDEIFLFMSYVSGKFTYKIEHDTVFLKKTTI